MFEQFSSIKLALVDSCIIVDLVLSPSTFSENKGVIFVMKRKIMILFIMFVAVLAMTATVIFAGTYRNVQKDTTCAPGGSCYDNFGVYIQAGGDNNGGCDPTYIGYIGWDLSTETGTWQSASLKLTHYKTTGGQPPFTLKVYPANNDNWTESGTDPGYDASQELASATYNGTDQTLTFVSDSLGTYFLGKKGGLASVAIVMTDGCGTVNGTVEFEDMEGSGGTSAPQSANEADLIFWTGGDATAVSVHSLNANSGPSWPMIAGLVALALAAVAGIGYGVRRFNS